MMGGNGKRSMLVVLVGVEGLGMWQLSLPRWAEKGIASYPGLHGRPKPANLRTKSARATPAAALRSPQTMFTFFGQFLVFLTPNLMLASLLAAAANQVRPLSSPVWASLLARLNAADP